MNRKYHTPHLERLAGAGRKFTQAYACSVCSPTRVSLMTGMNAARHRVTNWTLRKNAGTDARHDSLQFPARNVNSLCPTPGLERCVHASPLPELLRRDALASELRAYLQRVDAQMPADKRTGKVVPLPGA